MTENQNAAEYMRRAIALAQRGRGWTNPNPLVGAVIVKDGRIIGEGWHARYGDLHAERAAFSSLTESAEGAELYVTLEPCCHYGKQPPCTDAIIEHGIARVVVGSRDPNPKVAGGGVKILREAGIDVEEDFLREECDALNPVFFHFITQKTPYVVMKYAMTADGRIATRTGESKWITGEQSRALVQDFRSEFTGIMAGIGTVLADDPLLTVRDESKRSPVRIICDSSLRMPEDCRIVKTARDYRTIVACQALRDDQAEKRAALEAAGVQVMECPGAYGRVDLQMLMRRLGEENIDGILLEGGGTLNDSALRAGIVKEIRAFIAPKIFGGAEAKSPVEGIGVSVPDEAVKLQLTGIQPVGEDILLKYLVGPQE